MKLFKFNICLLLFYSVTSLCFSQGKSNAHQIIAKNKVTESTAYLTIFDQYGKDSIHYLESKVIYNTLGYKVSEIQYKKDMSLFSRLEYQYKHDSLGVLLKYYTGDNVLSQISKYKYNSIGKRISFSVRYLLRNETLTFLNKYDDDGNLSSTTNLKNGRPIMTSKSEFDKNGNETRKDYYNIKHEPVGSYLFEYNSNRQLTKTYQIVKDKNVLVEENIYNQYNLLEENIIYYTGTTTIYGMTGGPEKYFKGDVKSFRYSYNSNGLINEQSIYLSNKIRSRWNYTYKTLQ